MELIEKIERIDREFASAIKSGNVREIIAKSPWAWLEHELYRVPGADKGDFGPEKMRIVDALRLIFEFRSKNILLVVENLVKKSGLKIIKKGFLVYKNSEQSKIRLFLEYNANGHRPGWFKVLRHLCEQNRECTIREITSATGINIAKREDIVHSAPQIFWNSSREVLTDTRTNSKRIIKPEFYNNIYLKIRPWLTEDGYKVFEEWKKIYNQ